MKLYFSPGACSLAAHIALAEAGLSYSTKRVDLKTHTLADGTDYYTINAKGYVPVLELDDGSRLSEAAVILQYIADRKPGTLAPVFGSMERYRLMEWLNFIATELHKNFSPLWHPVTRRDEGNAAREDRVPPRLHFEDAFDPALSHGRAFHRCRRVPVHDRQLGADAEVRSRAVAASYNSSMRGWRLARQCVRRWPRKA